MYILATKIYILALEMYLLAPKISCHCPLKCTY